MAVAIQSSVAVKVADGCGDRADETRARTIDLLQRTKTPIAYTGQDGHDVISGGKWVVRGDDKIQEISGSDPVTPNEGQRGGWSGIEGTVGVAKEDLYGARGYQGYV